MPAKVYATAPRSRESLSARIRNLAPEHRTTEFRLRGTIGNIVIGQMLPSGAVKGGTAMALRHGQSRTRFSPDVDVTRAGEVGVDEYVAEFRTNLQQGGVLTKLQTCRPEGCRVQALDVDHTRFAVLTTHWSPEWLYQQGTGGSPGLRLLPGGWPPPPLPLWAATHRSPPSLVCRCTVCPCGTTNSGGS